MCTQTYLEFIRLVSVSVAPSEITKHYFWDVQTQNKVPNKSPDVTLL